MMNPSALRNFGIYGFARNIKSSNVEITEEYAMFAK